MLEKVNIRNSLIITCNFNPLVQISFGGKIFIEVNSSSALILFVSLNIGVCTLGLAEREP